MKKFNFSNRFKKRLKETLIIIFAVLMAALLFVYPDIPKIRAAAQYANIGVCVDPPAFNLADPSGPVINYSISTESSNPFRSDSPFYGYQIQVSRNHSFSSPLYDTGVVAVSANVYSYRGSWCGWWRLWAGECWWPQQQVSGHPDPRCSCDSDPNNPDCNTNGFGASASDPSTCYDWWSQPASYFCYNGEDGLFHCSCSVGGTCGEITCRREGSEGNSYFQCSCVDGSTCLGGISCYQDWDGTWHCSCSSNPCAYSYAYQYNKNETSVGQPAGTYSYTVPSGTLPLDGSTYYYRVRAQDVYDWTGWATSSFSVPIANQAPLVSNPRIDAGNNSCALGVNYASATFKWDYSDQNGDPQAAYQVDGSLSSGKVNSGDKSYPMDNLSCGATYSERVRVWDSAGLVSEWSNYASYTTPPLNHAPTAHNLQVFQPGDYCTIGPHASFSWNYMDVDGDSENSWQIQVDDNSNFSSPVADSGRVYSAANSFSTLNLNYNTTYYWQVRVWDSQGVVSSWASGSSFAPPRHSYPTVNFSWSPSAPSAKENVLFTDQSSVYGGASKSAWSWIFQSGAPGTSGQQNPTIKFTSEGDKQVSLTVTDSDGYACAGYKQVNINLPLPKWKEINPR